MGAVGAIVHWSEEPVSAPALDRMMRASAFRGTDGVASTVAPHASLARLSFVTTPTSRPAEPVSDSGRGLWLAFDGRLDNRDELLDLLSVEPAASDERLAFEAVARWGAEAPSRLLGDFAFVAWDERERTALCARDHFGIRHLHYHVTRGRLVCATDVAQVLAHGEVPREPNPPAIADLLARDSLNGSGTLFRDVHRVPPGHVLVAGPRGPRLARYWSPEPGAPLRLPRDADYAEACREILIRSVRARLRADRPVAALLSGGVDSSSVVTVAHKLAGCAAPPAAFSLVFPERPESDEREYIEAVTRSCGIEPRYVRPRPVTAEALRQQAREFVNTPGMPADESIVPIWDAIRTSGGRVALTGAGGDFLFGGSLFRYADLLRRGRVVAVAREFLADWREPDLASPPATLLQAGVWPLLPRAAKDRLRPMARRLAGVSGQPAWLRIPREPPCHPEAPRGGSYATEDVTRQLGSGMHAFFLECGERVAARSGIEVRHPLLDRRLVEFALDIPEDQRKRGPYTKFVLRNALAGHLAEPVRQRRSKGDFAHTIAEAMVSLGAGLFGSLRLAEAGWVDGAAVAALYDRVRERYAASDMSYGQLVPTLWIIASVELWYRAAFERSLPAHYNERVRSPPPGGTAMKDEKPRASQLPATSGRQSPRRKYTRPVLTEYGSVTKLTQGTSSFQGDSAQAGFRSKKCL